MDALPEYHHASILPPPYIHAESTFYLKDRHKTPWATLVIRSVTKSSEGIPIFAHDDSISGSFKLHCARTTVQDISIDVRSITHSLVEYL